MYFRVCQDGLVEIDRRCWEECADGIGIFDEEEWGREICLMEEFSLDREEEHVFFCKLERHASYLFGTFHIPVKKKKKNFCFAVYILKDRLIFVEEGSFVEDQIRSVCAVTGRKGYSLEQFLSDFFMSLVEKDNLYMASLERDIAELEETVLEGDTAHFHYQMLTIKKEISRLYCYYCQMADVGEILSEQERSCGNFPGRVGRLLQQAQSLREYAMQVQDVYQSEISIRQNDIMKLLTVVTTIFLPLTLIAGWYGMNFHYMPELKWEYGYHVVAGVSLLIVIVSLWFFRKKKFF